ncbi:YbjQ family protein [Ketobacter alkanivorans]|nr:heavy metal-binding domain-containing protein [Ketobacter alkanivorans]
MTPSGGRFTMLVTNIETIPGKRVTRHLGMVQGNTVRAKHVGRDIMANFKNLFGGELKGYTELLQEARDEAVERMCAQAAAIGANAVLNVRFSTSSITAGAAELFAYGTAVVLESE